MFSAGFISGSRDFRQYITSGLLDFDSFSWRVHLSYGVCRVRACVQLKTLSRHVENFGTRNCPEKFRRVRETHASLEWRDHSLACCTGKLMQNRTGGSEFLFPRTLGS